MYFINYFNTLKLLLMAMVYIKRVQHLHWFNYDFYFLGVDPVIVCYELVSMKSDNSLDSHKWVRSVQLVAHKVEVRSLVHFKGNLFSGGNYVWKLYFIYQLYILFHRYWWLLVNEQLSSKKISQIPSINVSKLFFPFAMHNWK